MVSTGARASVVLGAELPRSAIPADHIDRRCEGGGKSPGNWGRIVVKGDHQVCMGMATLSEIRRR